MTTPAASRTAIEKLIARRDAGCRLAALIGDGDIASGLTVHAVMTARPATAQPDLGAQVAGDAADGGYEVTDFRLAPGQDAFASLAADFPGAAWYERRLQDLYGITVVGGPAYDPLVLPRGPGARPPSPGSGIAPESIEPDETRLAPAVDGRGVFTIPYGPVRGGVTESVEYSVETPGEDILRLGVRLHAKHRGIENRFESMNMYDGALLAERVEGIASVAHTIAYCRAVERICDVDVPVAAELVRVVHAELERIANHLDVAMKAADGAALAVAVARFGWHKECVLRMVNTLCGNRFGRSVVIPGGVSASWPTKGLPATLDTDLARLRRDIDGDAKSLMGTASFLDRMRTTGPLRAEDARAYGALGPVARGSGFDDDTRWHRPYGAYWVLTPHRGPARTAGDALSRLRVRFDEVAESFELITEALRMFGDERGPLRAEIRPSAGLAVGAAEAPQGEVLYLVRLGADGRVLRCAPRSASFVNLSVFPLTFVGDIFTDFVFNEASFGVSIAGAAM